MGGKKHLSVGEAAEKVAAACQLPGSGQTTGWFVLRECAEVLLLDRLRVLDLLQALVDEPEIENIQALVRAEIAQSGSNTSKANPVYGQLVPERQADGTTVMRDTRTGVAYSTSTGRKVEV